MKVPKLHWTLWAWFVFSLGFGITIKLAADVDKNTGWRMFIWAVVISCTFALAAFFLSLRNYLKLKSYENQMDHHTGYRFGTGRSVASQTQQRTTRKPRP
jgi:Na+/melibiose symporter-like transporter